MEIRESGYAENKEECTDAEKDQRNMEQYPVNGLENDPPLYLCYLNVK